MKSSKVKMGALLMAAAVIVGLLLSAACGNGGGPAPAAAPTQESPASAEPPTTAPTMLPTQAPPEPEDASGGNAEPAVPPAPETAEAASPTVLPTEPPPAVQDTQDTTGEGPGAVAPPTPETNEAAASTPAEPPPAVDEPAEAPVATATPEPPPTPNYPGGALVGGAVGQQAPEFAGISNWINSPALTMELLRGKVVLIDFWTYTCVNCIRTLPYLRDWHDKYSDKGLVIVGVHSPEFDFEKVTENVERSAGELGVRWPIAQDNDFYTWRSYSNRAWPAKYLIDQHGVIRYIRIGEGAYSRTEEEIRGLLEDIGADVSDVQLNSEADPQRDSRSRQADPALRLTREIYGGYRRNNSPRGLYVAHPQYYPAPRQTLVYEDPGKHENQFIYLQGPWTNDEEHLRHARATRDYEDHIALKFFATSVNAVIDPGDEDPFEVQVTIDGRPLMPSEAGPDVVVDNGRSYFRVDEGRMYEVVALSEFGDHELKFSSNSPHFSLFALTFGAYEEGP